MFDLVLFHWFVREKKSDKDHLSVILTAEEEKSI